MAWSEDVPKRFEAYGWHTQRVADGNDIAAIEAAITAARADDRPSLIAVRTHIGFGSPNKQDSQKAHGSPLGPDEVRLTKEAYGWDPDKTFYVPADDARTVFREAVAGRRAAGRRVGRRLDGLRASASATWRPSSVRRMRRRAPDGWDAEPQDLRGRRGDRHAERLPGRDPGPAPGRSRSCSAAPPTCPNRT